MNALFYASLGSLLTEVSCLSVGSTGSGKSEAEAVALDRIGSEGLYARVLLDGHGTLARKITAHDCANGRGKRADFECLSASDGRLLGWPLLPRSTLNSLTDRRREETLYREGFSQILMGKRGVATLDDKPMNREGIDAAIRLVQSLPFSVPVTWLLKCFQPGSPEYELMLAHAGDADIVWKFHEWEKIYRRNPVQYDIITGGPRRLLVRQR